ncbi:hypothetical protein CKAH01_00395 [Colletotrichum kahawae]|uniref:Uncharacterized protein n=1 Tax=Colletotrichum kahawae TaxID=34407 RepID=A0AAD9YVV4_COLKA|nr:hypothetical protein CKAH01_00395 [Colletotrichum kahawae]
MGPISAKLHPAPVFRWAPLIRLILLALSSLILGVHVLVCLARRTAPVQQNDWEWTRERPTASSTPASTRSVPIRTEPANFGIIFQQDVEHFPHGQERPCRWWPSQTLTNTTNGLSPITTPPRGRKFLELGGWEWHQVLQRNGGWATFPACSLPRTHAVIWRLPCVYSQAPLQSNCKLQVLHLHQMVSPCHTPSVIVAASPAPPRGRQRLDGCASTRQHHRLSCRPMNSDCRSVTRASSQGGDEEGGSVNEGVVPSDKHYLTVFTVKSDSPEGLPP